MPKTLWISDLDGTLLNKEKKITVQTEQMLNQMITEGDAFTIATARTPATVSDMLENIKLSLPAVVMNGAALYDLANQRYEHVVCLAPEQVAEIQAILKKYDKNAFIYTLYEEELVAYYQNLQNEHEKMFYEERKNKSKKRFEQNDLPLDAKVLYFTIMGEEATVSHIYKEAQKLPHIKCIYSQDVYDTETYYLEIYEEKVSKAYAIEYLRKNYGFEHVICFGDQVNDTEMFEACEEKYAVANAVESIKTLATAVIGHHHEDGVAKFIEERRKK